MTQPPADNTARPFSADIRLTREEKEEFRAMLRAAAVGFSAAAVGLSAAAQGADALAKRIDDIPTCKPAESTLRIIAKQPTAFK